MKNHRGPGGGPTHNLETDVLLIDEKEASRILNISIRKLSDMRKAGAIPFVPVEGSIRYSVSALVEWVREHLIDGTRKQTGGTD